MTDHAPSESNSSSDEEGSTNCDEDFAVSETMSIVNEGQATISYEEVSFSTTSI